MSTAHQLSSNILTLYDAVSQGQSALLKQLSLLIEDAELSTQEDLPQCASKSRDIFFDPFILLDATAYLPFSYDGNKQAYLASRFKSPDLAKAAADKLKDHEMLDHARQALGLSFQLYRQENDLTAVHYVLEHYSMPMMAIDEDYNTIFANRAARALADRTERNGHFPSESLRDLAREKTDLLSLSNTPVNKTSIKRRLSDSFHKDLEQAQQTSLETKSGPISIIIAPSTAAPEVFKKYNRDRITWVYLLEGQFDELLDHNTTISERKLSPAEKNLAAKILGGYSLGEIAEHRNVSKQTVRKQLQSVLRKTECESQESLLLFLFDHCVHYCLRD